jgi:DNA invertase Pin-like site-specific DNA recombinase
MRTSSATNVGEDKDSDKRQMAAIESYAKRAGYEIVAPAYYDAAVSGADSIEGRSGFAQLLERLRERPDIRVILVESAHRFARDLIVQETGYRMLRDHGIELIPVDSPQYFTEDTPTATMVRQILGAVSQFQKAMLVSGQMRRPAVPYRGAPANGRHGEVAALDQQAYAAEAIPAGYRRRAGEGGARRRLRQPLRSERHCIHADALASRPGGA